ncbi:hypothetical protein AB0F24_17110 [Streptomyces platensis]|uniref:hypothetical protein n=1 Tax=Streptomyces platensis TaxID=58346 RepID=UPI0033F8B5E0
MSVQLELPVNVTHPRRQVNVVRDLSDYDSPRAARPHASVAQPEDRALRRIAAARIRATALYREERAKLTPEQIADRVTSMADARIALCVATGNSLDDIDPSSGLSMSHSSYESVRHSWISSMRYHGFNDEYDRESLDKALAFWAERRPQYLDGDDWLAAGMAAHREYWQGIGHGCGAPYCEVHGDDSPTLQGLKDVS